MNGVGQTEAMASVMWGREVAEAYDVMYATMFDPSVLDPMVDTLQALAAGGPVLEFAVGTGRVALPLSARGVPVDGIELSPHMVEQLRSKSGADAVSVTIGDMMSTRTEGSYSLVYLVFNTITNVTTQQDQVAVFVNAAAHLRPGGCFLVEVGVPQLWRLAPGELGRVFELRPDHVAVETFDDLVDQISWSHHWITIDGRLVQHSAPYRYVWPSELTLMAQIAGLRLCDRWSDWRGQPFTSDSPSQVAVFEKPL